MKEKVLIVILMPLMMLEVLYGFLTSKGASWYYYDTLSGKISKKLLRSK